MNYKIAFFIALGFSLVLGYKEYERKQLAVAAE